MTATALPFTESLSLDAHLVDWYEALPSHFHALTVNEGYSASVSPAVERFVQPFLTIKWRYLNLRILLYRPSPMEAVLHRVPFAELTSDQRLCVRKCLTLSGEMIDSVKRRANEPANQYIAWPSTWYLLQTSMVPLLSLYVFREDVRSQGPHNAPAPQVGFIHSGNAKDQVRQIRDECHKQVQATLQLIKEMELWAVASGKMHDLINHLYQARDQHLRIWNNSEESPMVILGSPEDSAMQQPCMLDSRTAPFNRSTHSNRSEITTTLRLDPAASSTNMNPISNLSQYGGPIQNNTMTNQSDPFTKDWSMYNSITWPNATLESLFDLPDDFQYMGQDTFGMG